MLFKAVLLMSSFLTLFKTSKCAIPCGAFMPESTEKNCALKFQGLGFPAYIGEKQGLVDREESCYEWICTCVHGNIEIKNKNSKEFMMLDGNTLKTAKSKSHAKFQYSYDVLSRNSYLKVLDEDKGRYSFLNGRAGKRIESTVNTVPDKFNAIRMNINGCK